MRPAEFPHLCQFLAGYFNQDWDLDYLDAPAVIAAFARDVSADDVQSVIAEIEMLLGTDLSAQQLGDALFLDLGCFYEPLGMSHAMWLHWVEDQLRWNVAAQRRAATDDAGG